MGMYIHEAIMSRSISKPFITRRAWQGIISDEAHQIVIKIRPTDTPECCVYYETGKAPCSQWYPRAEDLCANDWEVADSEDPLEYTLNELRIAHGLSPIDGGDRLLAPLKQGN